MKYFITIVATLAIAATVVADQSKERALKALQGTWVITTLNGQAAASGSPELALTFTDDKYHQTLGGQVNERGSVKVDATKKPMTIDLIITEGSDAGKTQLGIIEISGETMRANLDTPGAMQRPTDFTAKEGFLLFEAKKKKT